MNNRKTPLHFTAKQGYFEIVKYIVDYLEGTNLWSHISNAGYLF